MSNREINQCDGCRRGLPINEHGIHVGAGFWSGDPGKCTKDRYTTYIDVDEAKDEG